MEKIIVSLKNINKKFDKQIIFDNFNLDIFKDEVIVFLGYSGVGKSTLLRMIGKLDNDFKGHINYNMDLKNTFSNRFPVVFQNFDQLFPWYKVRKNIMIPFENHPIDNKIFNRIIKELDLQDALEKYPNQLSGGMKQRAAIARAILTDSEIILMDEPFGSLDIVMRRHLQKLIFKIKNKFNKTIVFITHDIEEAVFLADRIVILKSANDFRVIDNYQIEKKRYTDSFDKQVKKIIEEM